MDRAKYFGVDQGSSGTLQGGISNYDQIMMMNNYVIDLLSFICVDRPIVKNIKLKIKTH